MIVAIFFNEQITHAFENAKKIVSYFDKKKITVVSDLVKSKMLNIDSISDINEKKISYIISLGGDGTILRIAHKYNHLQAPILGINLGNLGFMADIPEEDISASLDDLLDKKYEIQDRIVLEGIFQKNQKALSFNDIVFHRAHNHSLIELSLFVGGKFFNTFAADGLIISTPNGSTAYSLSAGGPIVSPELDVITITPICPHAITNRPIVISAESKIEVKYLSQYKFPIEVHLDGRVHFDMNTNDTFSISKSKMPFKLIKLSRHDYFSTLREKLNWSGKIGTTLNES